MGRVRRRMFGLTVVVLAAGVLTSGGGAQPQDDGFRATNAAQASPGSEQPAATSSETTFVPAPPLLPSAPPPAPPAPSVAPPPPRATTPCGPAARACFKLSTRQAWLVKADGSIYGPVPLRHGRPGNGTPTGTFRVQFHSKHHKSTLYSNAPMPNAVFFNGNIASHQGDLRSDSHGCIRLSQGASLTFFNTLSKGDVVVVIR